MEDPALEHRIPHANTLQRLAKALGVKPEALVGDTPFPGADDTPSPEPRRVPMGVEIAPKARLAYDLIKHRYGVSATEIVSVAPLIFTLLAEQSLSRRRERLEEAGEAIERLDRMGSEVGHSIFLTASTVALNAGTVEGQSIEKADIFGEHLLSSYDGTGVPEEPFDSGVTNPFAAYLRLLADNLDRREIVDTKEDLSYGSTYGKFPDYDICAGELDEIADGSADARRALEVGFARLSDIPEELKGKDRGEERAAWLKERLPDFYKDLVEGQRMATLANFQATATPGKFRNMLTSEGHGLTEEDEDIL